MNDQEFDAYLANTGSMISCFEVGDQALIVDESSPTRKIPYTVYFIQTKTGIVMVNTQLTNKLFYEFLNSNRCQLFKNAIIKPEFVYKESRFDFLVTQDQQKKLVELKNCTLKINNLLATFPDAVSTRGQKHLKELSLSIQDGFEPYMIYLVARNDVSRFTLKQNIDPIYFQLAQAAMKQGVHFKAFQLKIDLPYFYIDQEIDLLWD